ncbi:MAG: serine dehydrogenasease [Candidatus Azobacteroides sp.]|nr:serine dehydrogenasease [Candidatus Azobacteroides sp.]
MKNSVNIRIQDHLNHELERLELCLSSDVLTYTGPIIDGNENIFLQIVEDLSNETLSISKEEKRIAVMLTTGGGSALAVERYVNILRQFYGEVNFIVPDHAFSAGTIFCMSGDNIFMDFFSVLGPIDPQVKNKEGRFVPALGYLDKINELLDKAKNNKLTNAEFIILKEFDLAELRGYEQARDLSIDLLKKWLVKYKFKNWSIHNTTNIGAPVTLKEKESRAEDIAKKLSDNKRWKSHGRPINIEILEKELKLKIVDYSTDENLRDSIRSYYMLADDYIRKNNIGIFIHTKKYI